MQRKWYQKAETGFHWQWTRIPKVVRWFINILLGFGLAILANNMSEGKGLVIYAIVCSAVFFGWLIYLGDSHSRRKKVRGLFWNWLSFSAVFFGVLLFCKSSIWTEHRKQIAQQKDQLAWFTNVLVGTNKFFTDKVDDLTSQNHQLRQLFIGQKTTIPPNDLLGIHTETNTISITNQMLIVKTNAVTVTATNFINIGFIQPNSLTNVSFVLDFFQLLRIRSKLDGVSSIPITVISDPYDMDGGILARQIAQVFLQAGFPTQLGIIAISRPPNSGVTIAFRNQPQGAINDVFMQLFKEFSQSPQYDFETGIMPTNAVFIYVTMTKTTTKER